MIKSGGGDGKLTILPSSRCYWTAVAAAEEHRTGEHTAAADIPAEEGIPAADNLLGDTPAVGIPAAGKHPWADNLKIHIKTIKNKTKLHQIPNNNNNHKPNIEPTDQIILYLVEEEHRPEADLDRNNS